MDVTCRKVAVHDETSTLEYSIRRATPDDAERMLDYLDIIAEEHNRFLPIEPGDITYTIEQEKQLIERVAESGNSAFFVIEAGQEVVGIGSCFGGKRKADRHVGSLGMTMLKSWRNRGVGTALLDDIVEWAKQTDVLERLELQVFSNNARAIHLYEKCGFVREGLRKKAWRRDDTYVDDVIMALLLNCG